MNIKGAIFDMDGTLTDSMRVWRNLGELYLESKGIVAEPGLREKIWPMTMLEAAEYLRQAYGLRENPEQIVQEVYQLIEDFYRTQVQEKPGVRRVLEELRQEGIPMCVASATDTYLVEYALENVGLRSYFRKIFCCREVGAGKTTDKIYQIARESLGTSVEETLIFEDALYAARTAKRSGFPLAAIYDATENGQEELREIADIYLESYEQWPGIQDM